MKFIKNNKGVTLIELIVIIAIMSILTATFALSFNLISRQRVSNAASETKSILTIAKTYTKSKDSCWVSITGNSDGSSTVTLYIKDADGTEKIGYGPKDINKNITCTVYYEGGLSYTITNGKTATIEFDRKTGGFKKVSNPDVSSDSITPTEIVFSNGDKASALVFSVNTGVITVESRRG